MFAIEEDRKAINGRFVQTFARTVKDHNTELDVEAGTTGYKGSNKREAGGRTYVKIECCCGDFFFDPVKDEDGMVTGIEIACCGDEGLNAIVKAVDFVRDVMNDQICEVNG